MKTALAVTFALLALNQVNAGAPKNVLFKSRTLPIVKSTISQQRSYAKNPSFLPKLDSKPTGKDAQPKSAGATYLKIKSQIIGGSAAAQKQFPWQVYMYIDNAWLCGGSLISAQWVLTAAHCAFGGSVFEVTIGGVDRNTNETGEITQVSNTAFVHENYDDNSLINDVALVQLPTEFTLNEFINVVRLPKQSDASNSFAGASVTASGYGMAKNRGPASTVMNYVSLTILSNSKCASFFGATTVISSCICTAADKTKSICSGDSGGPLMYMESDGRFTQIGVVSFGSAQSCTKFPSGYARVTSFLGWISAKSGIMIAP